MNWIQRLFRLVEKVMTLKPKELRVKGNWPVDTVTPADVIALGYRIEQARIKEWCSALQLVCPYCDKIQTRSSAIDVVHSPPDYWGCEACGQLIGCLEGRNIKEVAGGTR